MTRTIGPGKQEASQPSGHGGTQDEKVHAYYEQPPAAADGYRLNRTVGGICNAYAGLRTLIRGPQNHGIPADFGERSIPPDAWRSPLPSGIYTRVSKNGRLLLNPGDHRLCV